MAKAPPAPTGDGQEAPVYVKHPDAGTGHLAHKLARIAGTVGVLSKDGTVTAGRSYSYATIGQMAAALAPRIADEGVAILPVGITDLQPAGVWEDEKFGVRWITHVEVEWLITDGTDELRATTRGKSLDSNGSEKDTNQALTFARINLYKLIFHLSEQADDPEGKGQAEHGGARRGGGAPRAWDGSIPDTADATVEGMVVALGPGQGVALSYDVKPRAVQAQVNEVAKALGARWMKDDKMWGPITGENVAHAVTLARAIGLTVPPTIADRFPVQAPAPAPASEPTPAEPEPDPAGDGADPAPEVPADAEGIPTEQVQFPTVGEQTHTDPPD